MKTSSTFIVIVAAFLVSCTTQKHNDSKYYLLESSIVKKIQLDSGSKMFSLGMQSYVDTNDVAYITILNNENAKYIDFYSLDSCKFIRRLNIDIQKNNLPMIDRHVIYNSGDIYVSNIMPPNLCKLDAKGNVVTRYDLTGIEGVPETYLSIIFSMNNYIPIVIDGSEIICPIGYSLYRLGHNINAEEVPIALIVDTTANTVRRTSLTFPNMNIDVNKPGYVIDCHSRVFDGERYVYSFGALSDLYVTTDFESFTTVKAESNYIGQVKNESFNAEHATENRYANYFYTRAEYGNIVWDKYNAVFYRFCHAKCKESDKVGITNLNEYYYSKGDFSIQIFNKNLEVIGETFFESGKYAPKIFFLDKHGLWLSENNIERADMTEDVLVFRCLELVNNTKENK